MIQQPWTYNFPEFEQGVVDPMKRSPWAGDSIYNYAQLPNYTAASPLVNNVSGYGGFTNVGMPQSQPLPSVSQPAGNFTSAATAGGSTATKTPAFNAPPAPPPITTPNTGLIGNDIAQYYTAAMKNDPRMANIMSNLTGQVPADVLARIEQVGAERGVGIGSYGGGNDQTAMLRALGLTSMDLKDKGVSQYGDFYNSVPKLNPDSLFVSPTEQAKMNLQRELTTQDQKASWDRLQSQINATASLSDKDRAAALHLAQLGFQNKAYLQDQELAAAKLQYEYLAKNQYNMSQNAINSAWRTFLVENNTRRDLGYAALDNQANQTAAQLGQAGYMFDAQRSDASAGSQATSDLINSILNRNRGLLTGGADYGSPVSGGGNSNFDFGYDGMYQTPDVAYGGFERDFAL
jgi:hypothetical protein